MIMLYVAVQWSDIQQRIKKMIRSVFESAAIVHPEMHSTTSRAMYGVDVMLDNRYQPKLLEVLENYSFSFGGIRTMLK